MHPKLKIDKPTRFFLSVNSILISIGIWLTGVGVAHWILYILATFLMLAAIFGICPGLFIARALFSESIEQTPSRAQ